MGFRRLNRVFVKDYWLVETAAVLSQPATNAVCAVN